MGRRLGRVDLMAVHVTDKDNGYAALIKRVIGMTPVAIATGILAAEGDKPHDGPGDLTLIEVAVWNHFGTMSADGSEHIPSRPFITGWFDENEGKLREMLTALMRRSVKGELTRQQVLDQMGAYCVGSIQKRIADGWMPENAQSTIDRKGSSTPLINKGQLRGAISYEVREGSGR